MNKKVYKILLIVVLSIIAIALTIFMILALKGNYKFSSKNSNELVINETYDINFSKIKINSTAANIYIKESSSNETIIKAYGKKEEILISTDNNELSINIEELKCIGICLNMTISKVEIYLPKEYKNIIKVDNDYGNIEIENFPNSHLDVKADCGNIEVGEVNSIKANNSYGNINIDYVSSNLAITNDCGNIVIKEINLTRNSKIEADFGNIEIGKTNEIYIKTKVDLGNIEINNNYPKSDIILDITNDCGNIEIDN